MLILPPIHVHRSPYPKLGTLVSKPFKTIHHLHTEREADADIKSITELGIVVGIRGSEVMQQKVLLHAQNAEPRDLG